MKQLLFGTAGIPLSTKKPSTITGIERVKELNLQAMELEFVRSINITKEKTPIIKKTAKENNIALTCHAPYYINLASLEKKKYYASINYITKSAEIANLCGAWSVTFHPGFYQKREPEIVYKIIKKAIKDILNKLSKDNQIWIRPETTGKPSQFGSLTEILKLSKEFNQVQPCIDFAHLHARTQKYNTKKEFKEILTKVEKYLGKTGLNNMHIHLSGIEYTSKGEKHHLTLNQSDFNYKDLLKVWKEFKIKGIVISESPNLEQDALLIQKIYKKN